MTPLDALHHLQERPTRSALASARRALAVASAGPLRDHLAVAVAVASEREPAPETVVTLARAALDLLPALPVSGVAAVGGAGGVRFGRMTAAERIAYGAVERDLSSLVTYPSTYGAGDVLSIARRAYVLSWTGEAREAAARLERWATGAEREEREARVAAAVAASRERVGALGQSPAARGSGR